MIRYRGYHITNAKQTCYIVKWYPPVIWYPCTKSLAIFRAIIIYIYPFLAARYGRACGDGRNERCWTYYWQDLVLEAKERALLALAFVAWKWASAVRALASVKKRAQLWRISLALVARKLLLRLLLLILHQGPQDILGDFPEDWLETVDKDEIKSISLFYVITLCVHFPLLKLKLQSMLHP